MSPAIIRRHENQDLIGWGRWIDFSPIGEITLDCWEMPGGCMDNGLEEGSSRRLDMSNPRYGYTGESMERWVTNLDHFKLQCEGFRLKYFMVPPGSLIIGDEQVVFDKAVSVEVESW